MKIIRKKVQFCSSSRQQALYHEKFGSYKEFYDVIMSRQPNASERLEDILLSGGSGWVGVNSVEEAKNLLLNGWQQNVERVKATFNRQLNCLEKEMPRKLVANVAGFMPIVPNALLGLPNSMIDVRMAPKKSKILNFMVSLSRASSNSVETIIEKMGKVFAYVAMLERSGQYRCRISCFGKASAPDDHKEVFATFSVLVKSENQLFDIKRLCFPVVHPAMLRLFSFAWADSLPLDSYSYKSCGYGTAFEKWNKQDKETFLGALTEGNEKTIAIDMDTDIEELLG